MQINRSIKLILGLMACFAISAYSQTFESPELEPEAEPENDSNIVVDNTEDSVETSPPSAAAEASEEDLENAITEQGDFSTFVPSEDISEDYSVPFPVDI